MTCRYDCVSALRRHQGVRPSHHRQLLATHPCMEGWGKTGSRRYRGSVLHRRAQHDRASFGLPKPNTRRDVLRTGKDMPERLALARTTARAARLEFNRRARCGRRRGERNDHRIRDAIVHSGDVGLFLIFPFLPPRDARGYGAENGRQYLAPISPSVARVLAERSALVADVGSMPTA